MTTIRQSYDYCAKPFESLQETCIPSLESFELMVTMLRSGQEMLYNKRAQRALGRSPEEKVKGYSGANNREPQGHNLNNFGKGPFDDVIY